MLGVQTLGGEARPGIQAAWGTVAGFTDAHTTRPLCSN
jgi:hypothetical protein